MVRLILSLSLFILFLSLYSLSSFSHSSFFFLSLSLSFPVARRSPARFRTRSASWVISASSCYHAAASPVAFLSSRRVSWRWKLLPSPANRRENFLPRYLLTLSSSSSLARRRRRRRENLLRKGRGRFFSSSPLSHVLPLFLSFCKFFSSSALFSSFFLLPSSAPLSSIFFFLSPSLLSSLFRFLSLSLFSFSPRVASPGNGNYFRRQGIAREW